MNMWDPSDFVSHQLTANQYQTPNKIAPHLCIWSAVVASCAIPGIFESIQLVVKEPDGNYRPEHDAEYFGDTYSKQDRLEQKMERYSDGSIERDLPMQQLSELFNVNHFIVSQVNPHSFLLSSLAIHVDIWTPAIYGAIVGYLRFLKAQCRDWLRNIIDLLVYRSVSPEWAARRGFAQILTQEYEGKSSDVNIMPWAGDLSILQAFLSLMRNPTNAEYQHMIKISERNTWPHISRIRAHCQVEMALDQCVQKLRRTLLAAEKSRLTIKDRTPSFYTTRSIVNLSGLSVVDPVSLSSSFDAAECDDSSAPGIDSNSKIATPLQKQGITKTTSMTNFYYSREKSDGGLSTNGN